MTLADQPALSARPTVQGRPFVKMNGLGNDFAVVQAPLAGFNPSPDQVRSWSRRIGGIGFDQLIAISGQSGQPPLLRFWNSDGEPVGACGKRQSVRRVAADGGRRV